MFGQLASKKSEIAPMNDVTMYEWFSAAGPVTDPMVIFTYLFLAMIGSE